MPRNPCYFCDFCYVADFSRAFIDFLSFNYKTFALLNLLFLLYLRFILTSIESIADKILVTFAIFATDKFAAFRLEELPCDFCYTFLQAVCFKYFLLKLLPGFACKFLLQLAILDRSVLMVILEDFINNINNNNNNNKPLLYHL